jgi:hypothetical protein
MNKLRHLALENFFVLINNSLIVIASCALVYQLCAINCWQIAVIFIFVGASYFEFQNFLTMSDLEESPSSNNQQDTALTQDEL